jgi:calcium-binding protein
MKETAKYINFQIRHHIENAVKYNSRNFAKIDILPKDGLVSWMEYHTFFLKERGLDDDYILNHSEKKHHKLDRKVKETIMRDKAMWSEAAMTDEFNLNAEEFLAFVHPESSNTNLESLVDDILRKFDLDGDDCLRWVSYFFLSSYQR